MHKARILAVAVPSLLAVALAGAPAQAASTLRPPTPHCLSPEGEDLNELFHVKERIIGPQACRTAFAKEKWVRSSPAWETARDRATAVYPAGYETTLSSIEDLKSKLVSVTYVQDIGTPGEEAFTFGKQKVLRTGVGPTGYPYAAFVSPPFEPLDIGSHTSTVFVTLSAEHCDGLGTDREENCLPEGTTAYTGDDPFEVIPRPRDQHSPHDKKPENGKPEYGKPDLGIPEYAKPDLDIPEYGIPEFWKPEHGKPEHGRPDHGKPENGKPENGKPENGKPENGKPENGKPENGKPENGKPENGKPENGKPENGKPENGKPENGKPENGKSENGKPEHGEAEHGNFWPLGA
ncbi:hypothetical protein [Streptomyces sp. NPDC051211]|uniref:hypothetical protein n=1 Tax=Streptomyces sp. NPDC051211 TaxID=3154643 RepID=UPI0034501727